MANPEISRGQAEINEMAQEFTSPEDQADILELQRLHDEGRAALGRGPENPALQPIGEAPAVEGKEYKVDAAGVVQAGTEAPVEPGEGSAYDNGRRY